MDERTTVRELRRMVERFVRERDWEQFHTPKNLSMGMAVEAAELMELFQWHDAEGSAALMTRARARRAAQEEVRLRLKNPGRQKMRCVMCVGS